jgi:proteasome lid subunit RPN8/RPN11
MRSPRRLYISARAWTTLWFHIAAERRQESCGFLIGRGDVVQHAVPALNCASDRVRRFGIAGLDVIRCRSVAKSYDATIIGLYHSHIDDVPRLSATDLAGFRESGLTWLVISIFGGTLYRKFVAAAFSQPLCEEIPVVADLRGSLPVAERGSWTLLSDAKSCAPSRR